MDQTVSDDIQLYNLIQSHKVEINLLKKQCKTKQCKSTSQRLPRSVRRRASSNNPKRLPKNLQGFVSKTDLENRKLTKKRKRRIKTRNIDPRRTSLHLWFTKRFKLEFQWGSFIPKKNNMKNQRLLYRCSKRGYIIYYLPFLKSILLNYSKEYFLEVLSHFCSQEDILKLKHTPVNQECTVHVYSLHKYPFGLLGPCQLVWINGRDSILLRVHIATYEALIDQLKVYLSERFLPPQQLSCSHIRFCGPKAVEHLKEKLSENLQPLESCQDELYHCCRIENDKHLTVEDFIDETSKESPGEVILYRKYLRGHIINIDLALPDNLLRQKWNAIVANRSQLVGGTRDMQVLAIDTQTTLYPMIGYLDCQLNSQFNSVSFDPSKSYIIRDQELLDKLNNFQAVSVTLEENAYIQVRIEYIKGNTRQDDLLYLPIASELDMYLNEKKSVTFSVADKEKSLGLIEFGCYSMEAARCKAIGVISLLGWQELIKVNRNIPNHNTFKQLFAYVRTKEDHVTLVTVAILHSTANYAF